MRQLASIQKVLSVEPIPEADQIEKITILGWELVTKKNEYSVNDLIVFCECDSILPQRPEFEFLAPVKYRIKTRRLRGQISQGIAFPLNVLSLSPLVQAHHPEQLVLHQPIEEGMSTGRIVLLTEGTDVTELMGVTKWEPREEDEGLLVNGQPNRSKKKAEFPSDVPKTDETRIQAVPGVLKDAIGTMCYVACKVDGSSASFLLRRNELETGESELTFHVCSRNQEKKEDEFCHFWATAKRMCIQERMTEIMDRFPNRFPKGFALQGELCGPGVQKNKLSLKEHIVFMFNALDLATRTYVNYQELKDLLSLMHLPMVPVIDEKFEITEETTVQSLVALATRKSALNPKVWEEGIVVRPLVEGHHRKLGRFSFKCINPMFLLKNDE